LITKTQGKILVICNRMLAANQLHGACAEELHAKLKREGEIELRRCRAVGIDKWPNGPKKAVDP
jgi:hypothetical protein